MRAITVCVDYSDFLGITLPRNRRHFEDYMIVTTPRDIETINLAKKHQCQLFVTEAFYDNGAHFNKYLPMEMGFDKFGRHGWLWILDADVVLPKDLNHQAYHVGHLYNPRRRMLTDLTGDLAAKIDTPWNHIRRDKFTAESPGYCQIFHADDPHLGEPPWHQTNWKHAGGGDAFFQRKWGEDEKIRCPWDVLHLGDKDDNWCGRSTPFLDGRIVRGAPARKQKLRDIFMERHKRNLAGDLDNFESEKI